MTSLPENSDIVVTPIPWGYRKDTPLYAVTTPRFEPPWPDDLNQGFFLEIRDTHQAPVLRLTMDALTGELNIEKLA